jgi:hypothetical protein
VQGPGRLAPAVYSCGVSDTLLEGLRLVSVLNAMSCAHLDAARAEQQLRIADDGTPGRAQHVYDPQGVLGLPGDAATPARLALGRIANSFPSEQWAILLPRPGRLSGLRGPAHAEAAALEAGVIVLAHGGTVGWLPHPVGGAMQWELLPVERPLLPPTPSEATQALNEQILMAALELGRLDAPAGTRPDDAASIQLGGAYDQGAQRLLDRAMLWREAARQGLAATPEVLHSHGAQVREHQLHELDELCCTAISAAASWPSPQD